MLHDFLLGFIKIHILHHASHEPVYGTALMEELRRHGYKIGPGALYPILHGLMEQGYLERQSRVVGGKVRKYYAITRRGRSAQVVHPRWAGGEAVWSIPCGPVAVDPSKTHVADEYIVVYSMDGDNGEPEKVKGQYTIYDTKPGDPGYSPLWCHNYVIVPRDSGYRIESTDKITVSTQIKKRAMPTSGQAQHATPCGK